MLLQTEDLAPSTTTFYLTYHCAKHKELCLVGKRLGLSFVLTYPMAKLFVAVSQPTDGVWDCEDQSFSDNA